MMHLLGKGYRNGGGDGVNTFDCSSLVRRVTGIDVSVMPSIPKEETIQIARAIRENSKFFTQLDDPKSMCIISMGHITISTHVGVWIQGGVLHCVPKLGVIHSTLDALKVNGFNNIRFWKYNEIN